MFCFRFQVFVGTLLVLLLCLSLFAWVQALLLHLCLCLLIPYLLISQPLYTHPPSLPPPSPFGIHDTIPLLHQIFPSSFRVPGACCAAECLANSEGAPPLLPSLPPYRLEYMTLSLFCPIIFPSSFRVPGACCAAACLANSGGTFISVDSKYDFRS